MNICVYGASSMTIDKRYIAEGEALGVEMAKRGHNLVFGAGANGLMGAVARGVYAGGGKIVGVVPRFFNADGILFEHCDEVIRTDTMRERKQIMDDRAEAFIVTPGGVGTFEEFFEMLTLRQLGQSRKPIAILNTLGYYDSMQQMLENAVAGSFMNKRSLELYKFTDSPSEALCYIENYKAEYSDVSEYKNVQKGLVK